MPRVFSDLKDGSGRRYYYSLSNAPGGVSSSAPAVLTIAGLVPTVFQQTDAFRTPATAVLTLNGLTPVTDFILRPAQAALSLGALAPSFQTTIIITNALPPDYSDIPSNPPTIIFVNTITPTTGSIRISNLELNVSPGGDIAYIAPLVGSITLSGLEVALPRIPQAGAISVSGLVPTLSTVNTLLPGAGTLSFVLRTPTLERSFTWVDSDAPPALTWTTTTGITA